MFRHCHKITQFLVAVPLLALISLTGGCGSDENTPEQLLKQTIEQFEEAAKQRTLAAFMEGVSKEYADGQNRNWKDVRAAVQFQFIRNPKIYTLKLIKNLSLTSEDIAQATVLVALAGRPIDDVLALGGLRADLYLFDLEFRWQEKWLLVKAKWSPAKPADFM